MVVYSHGPRFNTDGSVTFRVWAPHARNVTLLVGDETYDASPDEHGGAPHGWFSADAAARPGDRYAFSLDGGPERPDPATRYQPDGVHSRSALVDPRAWTWTDADFHPPPLTSGAIYELHIPTFTPQGTFTAAATRLPALRELGITHIEVMPVNAYNGERGWGYDGVGWYAVQHSYGDPQALAAFVDACHQAGLAVILDVVYNHLGPSGNYLAEFGPYLTDRYTTPWGDAPNVDGPQSDPVRAFIVENALMWLADYHIDGLRLDAVHGIIDTSSVHLLAQLSAAVDDLSEGTGRQLQLIAESDRQDPQTVRPRAVGGLGLDAQWLDDLHHGLHVALTGESDGYYVDYQGLREVASVYARGMAYDGRWSTHRQRTVGQTVPPDVSSRRFVTCIQNHDQVGNRAEGERLSTLVTPGRLRVGIALLCLSPTTPMLFMGDEFGATTPFLFFTDHSEPELDRAVREGRRSEFASFTAFGGHVPDPQDPATMDASCLDWSEADSDEGTARWRLWRDLLAMRRSEPALTSGDRSRTHVQRVNEDSLIVRRLGPPDLLIVANLATDEVVTPTQIRSLRWSSDASGYGGADRPAAIDAGHIDVPPETVMVFTC